MELLINDLPLRGATSAAPARMFAVNEKARGLPTGTQPGATVVIAGAQGRRQGLKTPV